MDIFVPSGDRDVNLTNLQAISQTTNESYHAFIRQQHNQRENDRYNRLVIERNDLRKRINNRISYGENSSRLVDMHESTIHHDSEASTSNQTVDSVNFELEESSNLLNVPSTSYILPTCIACKYCGARNFFKESKGFCCSEGKVKLFIPETPSELYTLFTSKDSICMEFKKIARGYNNHFAFTSFGVKYDKELFKTYRGIYTFRVQGQVYHYVNQLMPENNIPSYMQLYFYDTDNELQNRMKISENFVESTLKILMQILNVNPYSKFFRSLSNISNLQHHRIQIRCDPGVDQRVFNTPTTSQVAAVWVEDDENANVRVRDITIFGHSGESHKVHYYYGCYDPLQYPLIFPYEEPGWHEGIERYKNTCFSPTHLPDPIALPGTINSATELLEKDAVLNEMKKRSQVSCREYYSYKLQIRSPGKFVLLHTGRLFQQYVVDMYVKIETTRLDYFRNNQKKIRAELYQGILDSVENGETRGYKIGRKFVLPQSFTCGPRDLLRRYMDAMAIVQRYGKPDVFLPVTCNPNWPEIKQELRHNDDVQNRPDLIARIFRAKLEELKNDLYKKNILGPVIAHIYMIEFQKRGLPHAHLLLIFKCGHKICCAEEVDKIVSCEIPDKEKYSYLHSVIVKHNMHDPCGNLNPKNVCMEPNKGCKNKYSKDYCNNTIFGDNSYPLYRRRNNGIFVKVRGQMLDNRWVVPYNPYLSAKFDCHINVEVCSSIKAVKYLYKYVYKGHDRINFCVNTNETNKEIDEISAYQSARWISPPEAMWRIFSFNLCDIYPSVYSLQLHIEDHQQVTYADDDDLFIIIQKENTRRTMLTEFFRMNETNEFARTLLYRDFPKHFVWNANNKVWTPRKKHVVIGRIVTAHPSEGERYFLRILLNHIRGSVSFNHLRTLNGVTAPTYRDAVLLHGLLSGDNHCEECISEAILYEMPTALRRLFATLLTLCNPNHPKLLWDKFKVYMIDDYVHQNISVRIAELRALEDINSILESLGKNINDYAIVTFNVNIDETERLRRMIEEETTNFDTQGGLTCAATLNKEQQFAYDTIMEKVKFESSGAFFIDGPGGTGKTFLYKALLSGVRSQNLIALATASSGVSASLLPGGRTAHSRFKIPLETFGEISCSVSKQSALGNLLKMSRLIIWDEAPMVNRLAVEAVDKMFRDITDCNLLFGGKVVVLGGDFRQILPVVRKGKKYDIMKASLVFSYLWPSFLHLPLIENMRAKLDPTFCSYLLRIGDGIEEEHTCKCIELPYNIVLPFVDEITSLKNLIHHVFPDIEAYANNLHAMASRVILTPTNECVDHINRILLEQIPGEIYTYYSFDEALDKSEQSLQEDFLNSLTSNGIPPHELMLKINCPVMLLRNINPSEGLCNGTRLTCRKFEKNVILAEITTGEYCGKHVFLPRIPFIPLKSDQNSIQFKRTQFPIRPCFAMTINKAQGQTLDFVGLYFPQPVFCHGQLYVALSRAKTSKSIKVLLKPINVDQSHERCTTNVVYKEILSLIHK